MKRTAIEVLLCVLLCASFATAQYRTTYQIGVTDITAYATYKTNAWFPLAGGGDCLLGSLSVGQDGIVRCVGTDHQAYYFDAKGQKWTLVSAMGSNLVALAAQDSNDVWSLQTTEPGCNGSGYGIYHWGGSAWNVMLGCLSQMQAGDGILVGVNKQTQIWKSVDGGNTWSQPDTNTGWTYGAAAYAHSICGVRNGQVYRINQNVMTLFSPQPTGTVAGCAIGEDDPIFITWNTSGGASLYDSTSNAWDAISATSASTIQAAQKSLVFALDSVGRIYHWNVYAGYIYGATTGRYDGCPINTCPQGATHTGKLQVNFPHGLAGSLGTWTGSPTTNMNATSWDASASCDPLFGDPQNDPECWPSAGGTEHCNVSGQTLGSPSLPPRYTYSEDWEVQKAGTNPVYDGPYLVGNLWQGNVKVYTQDSCIYPSAPACEVTFVNFKEWGPDLVDVTADMALAAYSGPWSTISYYKAGLPSTCTEVATFKHAVAPNYCF